MKDSLTITKTKGGATVRATGGAAQALFDAMTKGMTPSEKPQKKPLPTVHIKPCQSEAITGYGYDPVTKTLGIQWKNGHAPELLVDVPSETFQGLDEAPSKGRFIAQHIRGKFKRLEA